LVHQLRPVSFNVTQDWRDSDYVVASQEDLMKAPFAPFCLSLPPELVDLLLNHHKLLSLLT